METIAITTAVIPAKQRVQQRSFRKRWNTFPGRLKETALNLISVFWQDIIHFVHIFNRYSGDQTIDKYAKTLRRDGIVCINDFLDNTKCDELKYLIENLAREHKRTTTLENGVIFNFRSQDEEAAQDNGMLDIFHIDRAIPTIARIDDSYIQKLLATVTSQEIVPYRRNAYLNKEVKNTRVFHIDNTQPVIYKAFIYLNDVPDESYGPYALVKRSHRFSPAVYFNLIRNIFFLRDQSTDTKYFNKNRLFKATGSKGTMVLSSQNAIHRGFPQGEGKERVALVFCYLVRSRLSFIPSSIKAAIAKNNVHE